jgi:Coenzyme PQQ synthesis protein D (PqqD)
LRRAEGVELRAVGDELFLVAPGGDGIHQLDQMASAAWCALSTPRSVDEIIGLFQAAFPGTPKQLIARDIEKLLAFLEDERLVVKATKA